MAVVGLSKREQWFAVNISKGTVAIGDLDRVPPIAGGNEIDLLRFYTKDEISQSKALKFLIDLKKIKIRKIDGSQSNIYDNGDAQLAIRQVEKIDNDGGGGGSTTLSGLEDVTVSNPQNAEVLTFSNGEWSNIAPITGVTEFSALDDVAINDPANGQFIIINDGKYTNQSISIPNEIQDLNNVSISTPSNGQALIFSSGNWTNTTLSIPSTIGDLSDVSITSALNGQFMVYNGSNWINATRSIPSSINDLSDVVISSASNGQFISFNGSNWVNTTTSFISNVGDDTSPSLGGSLDSGNKDIYALKSVTFNQEIYTEVDGSSVTVDWSIGQKQAIELLGTCVIRFAPPEGPTNVILKIITNGENSDQYSFAEAGSGDPAMPEIYFQGGTQPELESTSSTTIMGFYYDGTAFYGGSITGYSLVNPPA